MPPRSPPPSRPAPARARVVEESNPFTKLAGISLAVALFGAGILRAVLGAGLGEAVAMLGLAGAVILSLIAVVQGPKRVAPAVLLLFTCAFIGLVVVPNFQRARERAAQAASAPTP